MGKMLQSHRGWKDGGITALSRAKYTEVLYPQSGILHHFNNLGGSNSACLYPPHEAFEPDMHSSQVAIPLKRETSA